MEIKVMIPKILCPVTATLNQPKGGNFSFLNFMIIDFW